MKATSALDSRTEKDIQQALDEVSENQTTSDDCPPPVNNHSCG
jgi:hypothetical protein